MSIINMDTEYKRVLTKVRTMQNGVVVEKMTEAGIENVQSYGLSIAQIRMIAKDYEADNAFAHFLIHKPLRESKLMALFLFDVEQLNATDANSILNEIKNLELAEQASRLVLSQMTEAEEIVLSACNSENDFAKMTGFLSLAQLSLIPNFEFKREQAIIEIIEQHAIKSSSLLMRSISTAMRKFFKRTDALQDKGRALIVLLRKSDNYTCRWIAEEASLELEVSSQ